MQTFTHHQKKKIYLQIQLLIHLTSLTWNAYTSTNLKNIGILTFMDLTTSGVFTYWLLSNKTLKKTQKVHVLWRITISLMHYCFFCYFTALATPAPHF